MADWFGAQYAPERDESASGECHEADGIGAHRFQTADYAVFGVVLSLSALIGLFVGCGKNSTASSFLMGNRSMHFLPVALSIILGHSSAVTVLGNPVEMYSYGGHLYILCWTFLVGGPLATTLFLPVYENLSITSVNEYLKMRFHNSVRLVYSCAFVIQGLLGNGLVLYAPAMALAGVTDLNKYVIVGIVFGICLFYATIGGIKAIVWTDTLMFVVLLATMVGLLIRGTYLDGGLDTVWRDNLETGRLQLYETDITTRYSFWSVLIGGIFYWAGVTSANQISVQRLLSLPNYKEATKCIWLSALGNILISSVLFYLGMMIYSNYKDCDPVSAKMVRRSDQLLPLYVMDVMHKYPGVPGLFISCIFSTSIGAAAGNLNAMAAVTLRDLVIGLMRKDLTDTQAGTVSKMLTFGYGMASVAFIAVMSQTGGMLQTSLSMLTPILGLALGQFFVGMFFPWANWKGAFWGLIIALPLTMWLSWGTQMAIGDGRIVYDQMPISVEGCLCNVTIDLPTKPNVKLNPLYLIPTMMYAPLAFVLFLILSLVISGITGFQDPRELNPALISPVAKWFFNKLPASAKGFLKLPTYDLSDGDIPIATGDKLFKKTKMYDVRL